jgi:hypothetical protein
MGPLLELVSSRKQMVCFQCCGVYNFSNVTTGTWSLFSATYDGHFTTREMKTRPPPPSTPVQVGTPKETESNHHTLPIPNPFKSMMLRSTEHLTGKEASATSPPSGERKMWFSETHDVGVLFEDNAPRGLKIYQYEEGCLYGLSWCSSSICVSQVTRNLQGSHS